jgi:hypothetical protein
MKNEMRSQTTTAGENRSILFFFFFCTTGFNLHTFNALTYFCSKRDNRSTDASYVFVTRDESMDAEQLLLQQCMQGNDLDWSRLSREWQVFPYSLHSLMQLLEVYPYPLKLLSLFPPSSLLRLMETATPTNYPIVFHRLALLVSQKRNGTYLELVRQAWSK